MKPKNLIILVGSCVAGAGLISIIFAIIMFFYYLRFPPSCGFQFLGLGYYLLFGIGFLKIGIGIILRQNRARIYILIISGAVFLIGLPSSLEAIHSGNYSFFFNKYLIIYFFILPLFFLIFFNHRLIKEEFKKSRGEI